MNSSKILSSDLLDILFEKRNKMYGAYDLRKFYPNRVKTSLFIMLGMSVIFSAFTFLPGKEHEPVDIDKTGGITVRQIDLPRDIEKPKTVVHKKIVPQQKFLSKMEIVKSNEKTDVLTNIEKLAVGSSTVISDLPPGTGDILPGNLPGAGDIIPPPPAEPPAVSQEPVENPDIQASYPGGAKELIRFLEKNLHSPEDISEGVAVKIKFVVGFDGELESFDVVQDGGMAFNDEVIRVLKKMPKWNPGKKGGRNVRVFYYLPVKFQPTE